MKKIIGLLVGLLLIFGVAGSVNATIIDFSGTNSDASSMIFTSTGIEITVTGFYDGLLTANNANVTQDKNGLGISNHRWDSDDIDGRTRNDYLILSFNKNVMINKALFGNATCDDEFDFWIEYSTGWENILDDQETTPGWRTINFEGNRFAFGATECNDDFRVLSLDFDIAPVPEPATMMLFGIGLLGLAGLGRKKLQ